ncbi:MAG TPA: IS1595 family transposase [Terracidiphilus sp.]|nr:IS1595 family transposase [Terracidiphilus sp.]
MEPKTLKQAIEYFANPKNCHKYLVESRWPDGAECPRCGSKNVKFSEKYNRWQCGSHHERRQFTLKTGTIFEDSALGLDKWLAAMWLLVNSKNGVSSWEVHRAIGVTQKSAWFMMHRLREVLEPQHAVKMGGPDSGPCEVDEAYVGGRIKNMHRSKVREKYKGKPVSGGAAKAIVMGIRDRETRQVRAKVIPNVKRETLQNEILANIEKKSTVYTDQYLGYYDLARKDFVHDVVNHVQEYVRGEVHTNGIENFWSLLKRGLKGTYVAVEPFHLDRYVVEQCFRFNNRATKDNPLTDGDRFALAASQILGKRLTFAELTGKVGGVEAQPF